MKNLKKRGWGWTTLKPLLDPWVSYDDIIRTLFNKIIISDKGNSKILFFVCKF